jgi:hypothetical protein
MHRSQIQNIQILPKPKIKNFSDLPGYQKTQTNPDR